MTASGNTIHDFTTGDFTIACYVYLASVGSAQTIFAKKNTGTAAGYRLYVNASNFLVAEISDGTDVATATGTTALAATTWYYGVITRTSTSLKIFLDKTQEASADGTAVGSVTNTQILTVGGDSSGATQYLTSGSRVDHLEIYSDDLTLAQVIQKYQVMHAGQIAICMESGSGFIKDMTSQRNEENTAWTMGSWRELVRASPSDGASSVTSGTFTAKKYLEVEVVLKGNATPTTGSELIIQFNADTGTNYASKNEFNGAADVDLTTDNGIRIGATTTYFDDDILIYGKLKIINIATQRKLVMGDFTDDNTSGEESLSGKLFLTGKWDNVANQITRIDIVVVGGTTTLDQISELVVYGRD